MAAELINEISKLCEELLQLRQQIAESDEGLNPEVGAPASEEEIKTLVETYPHPLPEDYLTFLRVHNGFFPAAEWLELFKADGSGTISDRKEADMLFSDQADFSEWVLDVRDRTLSVGSGPRTHLVYNPDDGTFVRFSMGDIEDTFTSFTDVLKDCIESAKLDIGDES